MFNGKQVNTSADNLQNVMHFPAEKKSSFNSLKKALDEALKKCTSLQSRVIHVTPELAEYILDHYNKRNRPIRSKRVEEYARKISQGRMKLHSQGISFGTDGNLNNGQHRLLGVIAAGIPCEFYVTFGEDVSAFDVIDCGGLRSAGDVLSIEGQKNVNVLAATTRLIIAIDSGKWSATGLSSRIDNDEVVSFVESRPDVVECVSIGDSLRKKMGGSTTPLSTAIFLIRRSSTCSEKLPEFLDKLIEGSNLSSNSPILKLRDGLQTGKLGGDFRNSTLRNTNVVGAFILAWNRWVSKKPGSIRWITKNPFPPIY